MLPQASSIASNPGSFAPRAAQVMAHPGPPRVVQEGNSLYDVNYSFNGNMQPNRPDQSQTTVCISLIPFSWFTTMLENK